MTALQPSMGEVLLMQGKDWTELPDVNSPYYVLGAEGTFIHRRTAQGRGLVPTTNKPRKMPETGVPRGEFIFDGPPVPASIYAQAVHYFRRIFEKYHTEAEVIITQNEATKEYRLFVPTQSVSHGGVHSIYNPEHIARGHIVIGTFHSHCDFGSSHSSTDEGDARDMDGLHGTIGHVNTKPEMSLMYALNKRFFHFAAPFDTIVDTTDLSAGQAPEWWDRYILMTKPTDDDRQRIAPYADDAAWDRFMGRTAFKPKTTIPVTRALTPTHHSGMTPEERQALYDWFASDQDTDYLFGGMLRESREFNKRRYQWGEEDIIHVTDADSDAIAQMREYGALDADYWEDALGAKYVDELIHSELFTEEDLDEAIDNWPESGTPKYWENRMRGKLFRAVAWLRRQGMTVTVQITDPRIKPVPGQMTVAEYEGRSA